MRFLEEIISKKWEEVAERQKRFSIKDLKTRENYTRISHSLVQRLKNSNGPGIIMEFKRKSPSKGYINEMAKVNEVIPGYINAGAAGISILTDEQFFGGSLSDLEEAHLISDIPLLRKDFVIHPYQVFEAKAYGADVILLIAECLEKNELQDLHDLACEIGLEALVELHHEKELEKMPQGQQLLGVNNRNLTSFEVNLETSVNIIKHLPEGIELVSESGISRPETIKELWKLGYSGFLMGEYFMKARNPAQAALDFKKQIEA